jgi:3-hydroxybutyryl-CoA dehydrogenase
LQVLFSGIDTIMPRSVAVIGNGIIGQGVAEVFARGGWNVTLLGRSRPSLERAMQRIREGLALFTDNELISKAEAESAFSRICTTCSLDEAASAELVIEAVPEDMKLKADIFGRLDGMCRPDAILATSSGHPASEVDGKARRKERVIATHFWYPPQLLPLVEVCGSPATAPDVVGRTCDALRGVGKEPVLIEREVAGFIGNRIQFAALREAWSLWAAGVASAEAIDSVVRHSIGRRLAITGPIESADAGGLDTMYHFARFLQPLLNADPEPPAKVGQLVAVGCRGIPSGRGVYDWSRRDGAAMLAARKQELIRWLKTDQAARQSPTPPPRSA